MRSGGLGRFLVLCTTTSTANDSPAIASGWRCTCTITSLRRRTTESHETPSRPTRPAPTTCIHTLPVWPASANIRPAPPAAAHPLGVIRTRRTSAEGATRSATDRHGHRRQHLGDDCTPDAKRVEPCCTRTVGGGGGPALQHHAMPEHRGREYLHVVRHHELAGIDQR